MPKVTFVKKARKAIPDAGIAVGDSYYHWSFMSGGRGGRKRVSKTKPLLSQLTQSEFWSTVLSLQEGGRPSFCDLESEIESMKSELENLRDETQSKFDSMPDSLQQGPTGIMLEERVQALEDCIGELENVDVSCDTGDEKDEDEIEKLQDDRASEIWDEVMGALGNISCE